MTGVAAGRRLALAAVALFCLLAVAYTFSMGLRASRGAAITGDEPFYLLTTQSLLQDGDLDLRQQYASRSYASFFDHPAGLWRQSVPTADGRLLSPHNPGLSVLLVPGFALGGLAGAQVQLLLLAALTFALLFVLLARVTGAPAASWLATLAVGLSATAFVYATEVYPEAPAALALVAALLLTEARGREVARALALAAVLSAMVWLGVKYAPLAALVALAFLLRSGGQGRAVLTAAGALSAAAFVWCHLRIFGALTPYSVNVVYAGSSTVELVGQHVALWERAYRLWGVFIDQRFGVGRWAPVLLPAVPALGVLAWRRAGLPRLMAALVAVQVGIATFVAITMMGWWFPGRTVMTVLPLLAAPLAYLLAFGPRWARALTGALAVLTLAVTVELAVGGHLGQVTVAVDPFELRTPVFRATAPLFPNYTSWPLATWARTMGWLGAGAALAWALVRLPRRAWGPDAGERGADDGGRRIEMVAGQPGGA